MVQVLDACRCAPAGVTYVSPCYLECAKVELDYPGECNTTKPGAPVGMEGATGC